MPCRLQVPPPLHAHGGVAAVGATACQCPLLAAVGATAAGPGGVHGCWARLVA
jgi:hypothetical protein